MDDLGSGAGPARFPADAKGVTPGKLMGLRAHSRPAPRGSGCVHTPPTDKP